MKGVLLIIDGLGDLPIPALDGKTPLEAARTPVLDRLAAGGLYGLVDPIEHGTVPNTHSGAGLLLGMLPGQAHNLFKNGHDVSHYMVGRIGKDFGDGAHRVHFMQTAVVRTKENRIQLQMVRTGTVDGATIKITKGVTLNAGVSSSHAQITAAYEWDGTTNATLPMSPRCAPRSRRPSRTRTTCCG